MTTQQRETERGARFLVVAASLIVVVAGLRSASQLILPFLTAVFLAVVSLPVMGWLQRRKLPTPPGGLQHGRPGCGRGQCARGGGGPVGE